MSKAKEEVVLQGMLCTVSGNNTSLILRCSDVRGPMVFIHNEALLLNYVQLIMWTPLHGRTHVFCSTVFRRAGVKLERRILYCPQSEGEVLSDQLSRDQSSNYKNLTFRWHSCFLLALGEGCSKVIFLNAASKYIEFRTIPVSSN